MEAKSPFIIAAGVLSGLTLALACISAALLWEGHSLRRQLANATAETKALRAQQASAQVELAAQRAQLGALADEVAELRQAAAAPADPPASAPDTRRVRVFAGDRMVGLGWVMSSPGGGTNTDAATAPMVNVLLDVPAGAQVGGVSAPADTVAAPPYPGYTFRYRYDSYPYWPYLYTTGWIEWPGCTNPPAFNGGVLPTPVTTPDVTPPAAPFAPSPTVASIPRPSPGALRARLPLQPTGTVYPRTGGIPRGVPNPTLNRMAPSVLTTSRSTAPAASTPTPRSPRSGTSGLAMSTRR